MGRMISLDFSHRTKRRVEEAKPHEQTVNVSSSLVNSSMMQDSVAHLKTNVAIADMVDSRHRFEIANLIATEHAWRVGVPQPPCTPRYYTAMRLFTEASRSNSVSPS